MCRRWEVRRTADSGHESREVTYHAADRGASCAVGCLAFLGFALAIGMGLWSVLEGMGTWKLVVGVVGLGSGVGLVAFLRSPRRGRWEVTFDPEARVIRFYTRVRGEVSAEEISYDEVERIGLTPVERETSAGDTVTFQFPVIHLRGGRDPLRFDERLSIRDPKRAQELLEEMKGLLGPD